METKTKRGILESINQRIYLFSFPFFLTFYLVCGDKVGGCIGENDANYIATKFKH